MIVHSTVWSCWISFCCCCCFFPLLRFSMCELLHVYGSMCVSVWMWARYIADRIWPVHKPKADSVAAYMFRLYVLTISIHKPKRKAVFGRCMRAFCCSCCFRNTFRAVFIHIVFDPSTLSLFKFKNVTSNIRNIAFCYDTGYWVCVCMDKTTETVRLKGDSLYVVFFFFFWSNSSCWFFRFNTTFGFNLESYLSKESVWSWIPLYFNMKWIFSSKCSSASEKITIFLKISKQNFPAGVKNLTWIFLCVFREPHVSYM